VILCNINIAKLHITFITTIILLNAKDITTRRYLNCTYAVIKILITNRVPYKASSFWFCPFSLGKFHCQSCVPTSSTCVHFSMVLLSYACNISTLWMPNTEHAPVLCCIINKPHSGQCKVIHGNMNLLRYFCLQKHIFDAITSNDRVTYNVRKSHYY